VRGDNPVVAAAPWAFVRDEVTQDEEPSLFAALPEEPRPMFDGPTRIRFIPGYTRNSTVHVNARIYGVDEEAVVPGRTAETLIREGYAVPARASVPLVGPRLRKCGGGRTIGAVSLSGYRTALAAKKLSLGLMTVLIVGTGAFVIYGMVDGASPNFSRGRSPISTVVAQEVLGLLTLATLTWTAREVVAVARGKGAANRSVLLLLASLALVLVWRLAFAVQRAS
jgi:hypothetical protein